MTDVSGIFSAAAEALGVGVAVAAAFAEADGDAVGDTVEEATCAAAGVLLPLRVVWIFAVLPLTIK